MKIRNWQRKRVFKIGKNEKKADPYAAFEIIRTVFVYVFAVMTVGAAVIFAVDKSPQKSLFGYRYYTVLTPSMEPALSTGDVVIVKLSGPSDIKEGDIITFNPSADGTAYLTHRVTEKIDDYEGTGTVCFRTKGDANKAEDGFVIDSARVIGKVCFHIPRLGYLIRFVQIRWYLAAALIVMIFVLFRLLKIYFNDESKKCSGSEND